MYLRFKPDLSAGFSFNTRPETGLCSWLSNSPSSRRSSEEQTDANAPACPLCRSSRALPGTARACPLCRSSRGLPGTARAPLEVLGAGGERSGASLPRAVPPGPAAAAAVCAAVRPARWEKRFWLERKTWCFLEGVLAHFLSNQIDSLLWFAVQAQSSARAAARRKDGWVNSPCPECFAPLETHSWEWRCHLISV